MSETTSETGNQKKHSYYVLIHYCVHTGEQPDAEDLRLSRIVTGTEVISSMQKRAWMFTYHNVSTCEQPDAEEGPWFSPIIT